MKLSNVLILLGLGGVAYYFYRKKNMQGALRYSIKKVSLKGTNILLDLGILNPTSQTATINSVVGDFYIKNTIVGTIQYFGSLKIAGNGETTLPITIKPSGLGVLSALKNLLSKGGFKNLSAKIDGTINVNQVAFPLNIEYQA